MKKTESELESRIIVGPHGVAAEEDIVILRKVVGIGVGSLIIFGVGIVWAYFIQIRTMDEVLQGQKPSRPAAIGQYEVGIVNQRLFEQDWHAVEKIGDQQRALDNGWGDTPGQQAHPKLDQVLDRVITEQRQPPPAPPTPAPPPSPAPAPGPAPRQ